MGKLDGKVAVVTGASRGIGKAIALLFAEEGARVVCAARTVNEGDHQLEGSLNTTVQEIADAGGEAAAIAANVSEEDDCVRLIEQAQERFGSVDVLVNNAALNYYYPVVDYPTSRWLRAFAVNFQGPFMLSKAVLPDMIERGSGAIVNISSAAAVGAGRGPYQGRGGRGGVMYASTKAALEVFTQGLAAEVYEHGVSVTCVAPSQIVTTPGTIYHDMISGLDDPREEPPELMAKSVLLLATEPLDSVTGRVTYSQQILKEFGWIEEGHGTGVDGPGSGFSQR